MERTLTEPAPRTNAVKKNLLSHSQTIALPRRHLLHFYEPQQTQDASGSFAINANTGHRRFDAR